MVFEQKCCLRYLLLTPVMFFRSLLTCRQLITSYARARVKSNRRIGTTQKMLPCWSLVSGDEAKTHHRKTTVARFVFADIFFPMQVAHVVTVTPIFSYYASSPSRASTNKTVKRLKTGTKLYP
jgi:hypothetical protein